jgi:hypothetical protein
MSWRDLREELAAMFVLGLAGVAIGLVIGLWVRS